MGEEKEAQTITAMGYKKLTPILIDMHKPESLDAAVAKVRGSICGCGVGDCIDETKAYQPSG